MSTKAVALLAVLVLGCPPAPAFGARCSVPSQPPKQTVRCGFELVGALTLTGSGGLGRMAVNGDLAAVLARDEGVVHLVDLSEPRRPRPLGSYDDDARLSLDGDLTFDRSGDLLIYARQTRQFHLDGIHVLDVSDPARPALLFYQPGGGTLRIAYHHDGERAWVFALDAVEGLVVNSLDETSGALVPVHAEPLPALAKVGGPGSGGLWVEAARRGPPLLYAASGGSGLQIFDISEPAAPALLGTWDGAGLAEIEVVGAPGRRTVYAAREHWFDASAPPEIVVLDAGDPGAIEERARLTLGLPAGDAHRIYGLARSRGALLAAHATAGLLALARGRVAGVAAEPGARNDGAGVLGAPYAMDVTVVRRLVLLSDAATGRLSVLRPAF